MLLQTLKVQHFRNIESAELSVSDKLNLITGANASGKTSLLEAIYYLSHLRSFRTHQVTDLIMRDQNYLQLVANLVDDNVEVPLGIRRARNRCEIRLNRNPVKRVSDIAAKMPVVAIHPDSYTLITGSPSERRHFLDWGVFHVEHSFYQYWQRYRKAVQQRNAALKSRQKPEMCQLWNTEICTAAAQIDHYRQAYFTSLQAYLSSMTGELFRKSEIVISYRRGWPASESLEDLLENNLDKERLKGFTYYGPHRADLSIRVNGQSAQTCISRGQQKTLVAMMRLAQAKHYSESIGLPCVLLYDDLAAELDARNKAYILSVLSSMNVQLFLTAIEPDHLELDSGVDSMMFHVEHGIVQARELDR